MVNDVQAVVARWRESPSDRALWSVLSDAAEEAGLGLFVATREGIYRHEIIGVFKRLDEALLASVVAIEGESDHYHSAAVCEIRLGESLVMEPPAEDDWTDREKPKSPERGVATLKWEAEDKRAIWRAGQPGSVVCTVTKGWPWPTT